MARKERIASVIDTIRPPLPPVEVIGDRTALEPTDSLGETTSFASVTIASLIL